MKKIKFFLVALSLCLATGANAQTKSLDLGIISGITSINLGLLNVGDVVNISLIALAPSSNVSVSLDSPTGQLSMNATVTPNPSDPTGLTSEIEIELTAEEEGTINDTSIDINVYSAIFRIDIFGTVVSN